MVAIESTVAWMMPVFFAICLPRAVKRAIAFEHDSVNSGIESEFQLSSLNPFSKRAAQLEDAGAEELGLHRREGGEARRVPETACRAGSQHTCDTCPPAE